MFIVPTVAKQRVIANFGKVPGSVRDSSHALIAFELKQAIAMHQFIRRVVSSNSSSTVRRRAISFCCTQ
jgi:hypothetical protein